MMRYLADTNILLRSSEPAHPAHSDTVTATQLLLRRGDTLHVIAQNLIEFWNVATRPADGNGLGMTISETQAELVHIKDLFALLPDTPAIYPEWERLVVQHAVKGKNVHDTRIVAAMNIHGISHLLTFNGPDFRRFPGITILSPSDVE
jgi:predicted nucleic acid-binding protein